MSGPAPPPPIELRTPIENIPTATSLRERAITIEQARGSGIALVSTEERQRMAKPKFRIGIDVDGCVYPWTRAVNEALAERFGLEGLEEHSHWNYLQEKITKEQWAWAWSSDAAEVVFGRLDLIYPGARDAVNALCQEHEVHFVTHRHPRRVAGITGRWLNYHFRNYAGVHVVHNRCAKYTLGDWDVFIDDKMETVENFLTETQARVLVPVRPWNHALEYNERLLRFDHWNKVVALTVAA